MIPLDDSFRKLLNDTLARAGTYTPDSRATVTIACSLTGDNVSRAMKRFTRTLNPKQTERLFTGEIDPAIDAYGINSETVDSVDIYEVSITPQREPEEE